MRSKPQLKPKQGVISICKAGSPMCEQDMGEPCEDHQPDKTRSREAEEAVDQPATGRLFPLTAWWGRC